MTRTLIHGGVVFDGTGAAPFPADVVVEGDTIVDVGVGLDGDVAVDATGHTLLPGFFDCHVHVMFSGVDYLKGLARPFSLPFYESVHNLRATLECGITSVRDAGGADLGVKEAVRRGLVAGPRMQISVNALSQTGGHGDGWMPCGSSVKLFPAHPGRPSGICDGPDEARKKTREMLRAGADVLKIMTSGGVLSPRDDPRHGHFRDAEVAVMVEEATAAGKYVMSHAQAADGIKVALRNGVRSVEHGIYLDDEGVELLLERGAWLVPTMLAPQMVLRIAADGGGLLPEVIEKAQMVVGQHTAAVERAIAAGVRIAMGTDSGVGPHGDNLDEFRLLIKAGMTPAGALHTGTGSAAELLGVSDTLGTVTPGKKADLVLVEGDALAHAGAKGALKEAIRGVWLDGARVVERTGAAR
ncbi:hydrolase [Longispora fulva]|uniref:Imidazolonepropionase-like amidohydrolase n=1 Tax=Longispora fulva TaxID=619741 RepID=A0A8J7GHD2_9ACTN|nr:amidohydrolase family protein [Longispora fulva]MBG6139149.1 imidazolonepropionase-like amidohydrolase [Longispora fulva]GIG58641.1 hydrolase [Longispora fulva]